MKPIIIGAGIGGLTTAIALRREGIDSTIFEQADDLSKLQVGAGLGLWHNAMRVLKRLGLDQKVLDLAPTVSRFEAYNWHGKPLAVWPVKEMAERLGTPTVGMSRQDLYSVLLSEVPDEQIKKGAKCLGFVQDGEHVSVNFADGAEASSDLLIGADGLNSVVRAQLLDDGPPRYAGYAVWRATVEYQNESVPLGVFRTFWGRGRRFVYYWVRPGRLYWIAVANAAQGGSDDRARLKDDLLESFRGWAEPIEEIISATAVEAIHRTDIQDRKPVDRWGEGRVTLLGDAAHPMTFNVGQGAGQAMEDAIVLTKCLQAGNDVPAALRAYEAQRMPRTAGMVNLAWRMGVMGRWRNPLACTFRDRLMTMMNGKALKTHEKDMAVEL